MTETRPTQWGEARLPGSDTQPTVNDRSAPHHPKVMGRSRRVLRQPAAGVVAHMRVMTPDVASVT